MIQLTCTNCRALLVMDDAFAGGVCRCKHCGTIQTVPRPSRRQSAPGSNPGTTDTGQSKTLFQRPASVGDVPGSGTGLDDLANVVASSGLTGTGLSGTGLQSGAHKKKTPGVAAPPVEKRKPNYVAAGAIVGAMLAGALVTWLVVRNPDGQQAATNGTPTPPVTSGSSAARGAPTPSPTQSASFLGEPLTGRTIIYLLDRGQGTQGAFELTKLAMLRSIASLPPERRFQIIFWELDTVTTGPGRAGQKELIAFPPATPLPATPENLDEARKAVLDVNAFGQSRILPAMTKAMAADPDEIVIATGKYGLEPEVVEAVLGVRKNHRVKLRTFSLGESGSPEVMKPLADRTAGSFRQVPLFELRQFAE